MAIADKITSIEEHLQADYNSIEKLGIDLTNVNKNIENIAGLVDNIYDKFPKTDYAEGSNITLENTLKGKLDFEDGIVGIGDTKQAILPSEYQQVEYIESTGSAYIDTGIIPNTNTKIDIQFETIQRGNFGIIFGGEETYKDNSFHLYNSSGVFDIGFGSIATAFRTSIDYNSNIKYTLIMDKNGFDVNGATGTFPEPTISTTYSIYLFAVHRETNVLENNAQKRIYYCKLYNNGTLVRDMIPCYRVSDNVIGMYDLVSNTFFTNAGSGTFTKGANAPTPSTPIDIEVVRGKNRLNTSRENISIGGATSTINYDDEGYITITNNNSSASYINIPIATEEIQVGEQYTLKVEWGTSELTYIYLQNSNDDYSKYVYTTTTTTATNTTISNFLKVLVLVNANKTIKVRLQVEKGSQATSYLPYNTIEVKAKGKNLFDGKTKLPASGVINGITYTNNGDGTFNVSGTATRGFFVLQLNVTNLLIKEKKYGLYSSKAYSNPGFNYTLTFTGNSTKYVLANANPAEYDELKTEAKLALWVDSGATLNATNVKTMIYESDTIDTNYEPYITPQIKQLSLGNFKPSKIGNYKDHFYRTNGKNLFNPDITGLFHLGCNVSESNGEITITATQNGDIYVGNVVVSGNSYATERGVKIPVEPNTQYSILITNNSVNKIFITEFNSSNVSLGYIQNTTITTQATTSYITIRYGLENATSGTSYKTKIMVSKGTTATDYQPYGSGEWYFKEKNGYTMLKSELGWIQAPSSVVEGTTRFYCSKSDVANLQATQSKDILSNAFMPLTWNEIYVGDTTTKNAISDYSQENSVANRIVIRIDSNYASSVNELNTFLDNNDFYAYYLLATPADTKITDTTMITQLEEIYNLMSYTGTTILEVDGDLPMIMKVRALKGE